MKKAFFLILCIISTLATYAQNKPKITNEEFRKKREQVGNCKFKYPFDFKVGDRFIFVKEPQAIKENWEMYNYYKTEDMHKPRGKRERLFRRKYDGKIVKIIEFVDKSVLLIDHETFITFEVEETGEHISHKLAFSTSAQKDDLHLNPEKNQIVCLPYLIYLPEIDSFKAKYLGKSFYANFLVGEKKFEKVEVTNVGAGTDKAPIRVLYQSESGKKGYVDICTCGSNLPQSIIDEVYMENFFLKENPRESFKGSDSAWDSIQFGEIEEGMTEEELIKAWGPPKKITNNNNAKQYYYPTEIVNILNGKIQSFDVSN